MDAERILSATLENYRACTSYEDIGLIETISFNGASERRRSSSSFSTIFIRPDGLRFAYKDLNPDEPKGFVLKSNGDSVTLLVFENELEIAVQAFDTLGSATDSCKGITGGSLTLVAGLLSIRKNRFSELSRLSRLEDEVFKMTSADGLGRVRRHRMCHQG